ncbi:MAG: hypothetical protein ACLKAN_13865 [Alkaliphilus sp.]
MRIKPVSSIVNTHKSMEYQKLSNKNRDNSLQEVNLVAGKEIDLGNTGGKLVSLKIFADGGYETTNSLRITKGEPGSRVTPEQAAAAYIFHQYSSEEHRKINTISGVIHYLYRMTNNNLPVEYFNDFIKQANISQSDVKEAFGHLMVNITEPFSINGKTFLYENGTLKNYLGR